MILQRYHAFLAGLEVDKRVELGYVLGGFPTIRGIDIC